MDPVPTALRFVFLPMAAAVAVLLLTRLALRSRAGAPADVGPALAVGFAVGFLGIAGLPKFPPLEAWQWMLPLAVAGLVLAVVDLVRPELPTAVRWLLRVAPLLLAVWTVLLRRTMPTLAVLVGAVFVFAWTVDRLAARATTRTFLIVVLVTATATSASLVVSHWATGGLLCGALAASAGAALALGWRIPSSARGAVAVVALLLAAFWMNGVLLADLPKSSVALLAAAPGAAWLADVLVGARLSGARRLALDVAAALALAGAGTAVAVASSPPLDY